MHNTTWLVYALDCVEHVVERWVVLDSVKAEELACLFDGSHADEVGDSKKQDAGWDNCFECGNQDTLDEACDEAGCSSQEEDAQDKRDRLWFGFVLPIHEDHHSDGGKQSSYEQQRHGRPLTCKIDFKWSHYTVHKLERLQHRNANDLC